MFENRVQFLCLLTVSLAFGFAANPCNADPCDPVEKNSFGENVAFDIGGQFTPSGRQLYRLDGANFVTDHRRYGMDQTGNMVACDTGKENCVGTPYSYTVVAGALPLYTPAIFDNMGNVLNPKVINGVLWTEITADEINAFYDMKYAGYTPVGNADISQNCHGYAFEVHDWPFDGPTAPGQAGDGSWTLLNPIGENCCYEPASTKDSVLIAWHPIHTIKLTGGQLCNNTMGPVHIINGSSEKFRSSRIYEQQSQCPNSVDYYKAHRNPAYGTVFPFGWWKKVGGPAEGRSPL
ncbi:MAG: hypothetical protein R3C19_23180 [Planctomycetaceae bacterium]